MTVARIAVEPFAFCLLPERSLGRRPGIERVRLELGGAARRAAAARRRRVAISGSARPVGVSAGTEYGGYGERDDESRGCYLTSLSCSRSFFASGSSRASGAAMEMNFSRSAFASTIFLLVMLARAR